MQGTNELTIVYSLNSDAVDWSRLRQDLIADEFHNDRSASQLETSFKNSFVCAYAFNNSRCIGTARALSDEVCNCYVVDVWTQSRYRKQGIGRRMMQMIIDAVPGQHIYLQTDDAQDFYATLGFSRQPDGMFRISGEWLNHTKA
jgi:GNAT superfamily N-acetyltransferase